MRRRMSGDALLMATLEGFVARPGGAAPLMALAERAETAIRPYASLRAVARQAPQVSAAAIGALNRIGEASAEHPGGVPTVGLDPMMAALILRDAAQDARLQQAALRSLNLHFAHTTGDLLLYMQFQGVFAGGEQGTGRLDPTDVGVGYERDAFLSRIPAAQVPPEPLVASGEVSRVADRALSGTFRRDSNPSLRYLSDIVSRLDAAHLRRADIATTIAQGVEIAPNSDWSAVLARMSNILGGRGHVAALAGTYGVALLRGLASDDGCVDEGDPADVQASAIAAENAAVLEYLSFRGNTSAPTSTDAPFVHEAHRRGRGHRRAARRRLGRAITEAVDRELAVPDDVGGLIAEFSGLDAGLIFRPDGAIAEDVSGA